MWASDEMMNFRIHYQWITLISTDVNQTKLSPAFCGNVTTVSHSLNYTHHHDTSNGIINCQKSKLKYYLATQYLKNKISGIFG